MVDRVIGDRTEKAPRLELDRKNQDAVLVGGVLTDARAPVRFTSPVQGLVKPGGSAAPSSSLRVQEVDGVPAVDNVRTLIVPNASLVGAGAGEAEIAFPLELYPFPVRITGVTGLDPQGNVTYSLTRLNGDGNTVGPAQHNVPNLARPAATLAVGDQTQMGYSQHSDSFFFSEAT